MGETNMATNKIDFMTIRKLLALAGEIQNMRPDFAKRLEVFLPGLGRILNANRASAYQISFSSSGQKAVPLAEFRRTSAGLLQRTALVGARTGHLRLDAMQRAERVTTVRGVPPWLPSLTLRSMVARKHSLYS
ncbi:MAG TPA: hypothetical protein VK968_02175, partial [Roseimicrobium sp.]|nr:hypothetical protein [Roseimicrobium sp.]